MSATCGDHAGTPGRPPGVFSLLSTLQLAAAVLPDPGTGPLVRGLVRLHRRLLTRFTPRCPSTPSCSAHALTTVRTHGTRRGLAAAAHRIRRCGTARRQ